MTQHYLKIALRNMRRFKLQTVVCVTGLAVGMTCFALGTLWLRYIESFEDFVPDGDNIFLVMSGEGKSQFSQGNYYYTDPAQSEKLKGNVAGVTEHSFLIYTPNYPNEHKMKVGEQEMEVRLGITEADFIKMFGIEAVEGSLRGFRDGDAALTRSLARKLFGDETAVGREVMLEAKLAEEFMPFRVVAVIPDQPQNTQFDYEVLACCDEVSRPKMIQKDGISMYTYYSNACSFVKFAPSVPRDSIVGTHMIEYLKENGPDTVQYTFAPLTQLRTDFTSNNVTISTNYVRWFMSLGLLVILCSLVNYLITMVSHLKRRGWEFSLRRVLGSSRVHILYMVGLETLILFLLAAALAVLMTWLVMPYFREYSEITIGWSDIALRLAAYLLLVIACGMALSALTAWVVMWRTQRNILSSRSITPSLRGRGQGGEAIQLALSMAIIFCAVVMLRQVRMLMYSDELGFNHSDRAVVYNPNEELLVKLRQSPLVAESLEDATVVFPRRSMSGEGMTTDESKRGDWSAFTTLYKNNIDSAMFHFWRMSLVAGELPVFGKYQHLNHDETDTYTMENGDTHTFVRAYRFHEVVINEAACRRFGWTPENAIGQTLYTQYLECHISGVVHDTYQLGATIEPDPRIYYPTDKWPASQWDSRNIVLRSQPGRLKELCDSINAWKEQMNLPEPEFIGMEVTNCETSFEQYIASEQMLIKILFAVGGASLFVCVIGTFSLVSLSLQRRRKEIAIRKVHGARLPDILRLFLRGQVLSLALAALIAYPIAYLLMRHWLEGYQKQVAISWWLIPATFLGIAAVVLSTIILKIWRAAKESTVEALNS